MLSLYPNLTKADCNQDCSKIVTSADKLIQDLKSEVSVLKQVESEQQNDIINLTVERDSDVAKLESPFRNPIILLGIGISVGAITVLLLKH